MKALVSQAEGELGTRLVELLEAENISTLQVSGICADLPTAVQEADVVYLVSDADGTSNERYGEMREANLDGPRRLLDLVSPGQLVVLLSSVQVYAPEQSSQWPVTERHPRRAHGSWPTQVYGQQKIEAEDSLVRASAEGRFDFVLLRSSLRFGRPADLARRITADVISSPVTALRAYNGLGVMQWVSVEDVVEALLLAGTTRRAVGEAFTIAGDEPVTVGDLVHHAHGRTDSQWFAARPGAGWENPENFDTHKARSVLGWSPQTRLSDWLLDERRKAARAGRAALTHRLAPANHER